jgi:Fe-S oxidoreductase
MMCKAVCTTHHYTRKEQDAPEPRIHLVETIRRGIIDWDEKSAETILHCNLCGLCREYCGSRQDIPNTMATARADVVNLGMARPSVLAVDKSIDEEKNSYGKARAERFADIPLTGSKKEGADVVFFIGCLSGYDRTEIPKAMIKILEAAGMTYTIMTEEEWCCGLPAYQLGLRDRAKEMAEHNVAAIKVTGTSTVIGTCPGCTRALKLEYPKWGVESDFEVLHHTEFIEKLLADGKLNLKKPLPKKLTYHDPCHLGRDMGVYDAPREVLKKVPESELVEMWMNREKAICCGSGGGYKLTNPEDAKEMGRKVTREALQAEAELLCTACPLCKEAMAKSAESEDLELKDIAEIIVDLL